jgi:hypothetical protein
MLRNTLTIERHTYELAQNTDLQALKSTTERAVAAGGRFVDVTVVGNIAMSILITPGGPIFIRTEEVDDDDRDTGDVAQPYVPSDWDITDIFNS